MSASRAGQIGRNLHRRQRRTKPEVFPANCVVARTPVGPKQAGACGWALNEGVRSFGEEKEAYCVQRNERNPLGASSGFLHHGLLGAWA